MLVNLSTSLNPVYIGLLFMVLAYIGVGGVVNSAMEGTIFGPLGSVGVPGMFMLLLGSSFSYSLAKWGNLGSNTYL